MTNPRDFLGNEITPGCTIAYPNRSGSSMWMRTGTVETISEAMEAWSRRTVSVLKVRTDKGKLVTVSSLKRVVVVGVSASTSPAPRPTSGRLMGSEAVLEAECLLGYFKTPYKDWETRFIGHSASYGEVNDRVRSAVRSLAGYLGA